MDALAPGATVLGTLANLSTSTAGLGGGVVSVGVGVGSVVCDFVGDADGDPGEVRGVGDGVVAAKAADAVLLARTTPVPTVMISGFRTDRASTAYNLLNESPLILTLRFHQGSGNNHAIT
jgi:hypothetical protein